jgi:4-hydroxybenzoate polyprenyltransferase
MHVDGAAVPEAALKPRRGGAARWPRLYFCHVPKTGGSSLGGWLRSVYPPGLVMPVMLPEGLAELDLERIQGYRCFTGHFGTALPRLLHDPVPTVTLVREPIECSLSLLRFIRRRGNPAGGATERARFEAVIRHGDDLEACLDDPLVRALLRNRQSRFLGDPVDLAPFVGGPVDELLEHLDALERRPLRSDAEVEALARARLDEMAVVGVFERFAESADLVMRAFGLPRPREWPRENVAPERAADLEGSLWRDLGASDRVLEQLHSLTAVDRAIYAHAQKLLDQRLAEQARAREAQAAERGAVLRAAARWQGVAPRERLRRLWAATRFGEWWEHQVPPLVALGVLVYREHGLAVSAQPVFWTGLLGVLAGLGAFAQLANDWADRDADLGAGRRNRAMWLPAGARVGFAFVTLGFVAGGLALAGGGTRAALLCLAIVAAFLAYAFPPPRLKTRGLAGAVAEMLAVNTLPALLVLDVAAGATGGRVPIPLAAAAVTWLSAWGLRGSFWHQLRDRERDALADVETAAVRFGPRSLQRWGERAVFPVELAAFLALLVLASEPLAWAALAAYTAVAWGRSRLQGGRVCIVRPRARRRLVLQEVYEVLLPAALLAGQALRFAVDGVALACYALLFPRRLLGFARGAVKLARKAARRGRKAMRRARGGGWRPRPR